MASQIVVVDPRTGKPETAKPVTFAELGVKERSDLEEWIKENTDVLGARLLVITTEYAKFDKSEERLDLLALSEKGKIVVIEIKRDAAGTLADLQAIRYAAFCSTMTFEMIVKLRAQYARHSVDVARKEIQEFVEIPGFSKLDNRPGVILAAGGFDNRELTACVCWLRTFELDISCVEITPYRLSNDGRLILVPRVIIPVPEIEQYLVGAVEKEAEQDTMAQTKMLQFWTRFVQLCKDQGSPLELTSAPKADPWYKIKLGLTGIFLELKATGQPSALTCQVVVENKGSKAFFQALENEKDQIEAELKARLDWKAPIADGKRGRIIQTRSAEIESQDNWQEHLLWLKERSEAFFKALSPRVRKLKHEL